MLREASRWKSLTQADLLYDDLYIIQFLLWIYCLAGTFLCGYYLCFFCDCVGFLPQLGQLVFLRDVRECLSLCGNPVVDWHSHCPGGAPVPYDSCDRLQLSNYLSLSQESGDGWMQRVRWKTDTTSARWNTGIPNSTYQRKWGRHYSSPVFTLW